MANYLAPLIHDSLNPEHRFWVVKHELEDNWRIIESYPTRESAEAALDLMRHVYFNDVWIIVDRDELNPQN